MQKINYVEEEKIRIDKYLNMHVPTLSRKQIETMINEGGILVNNKQIKKSYTLKFEDVITIEEVILKELEVTAENIPLTIVFEDKDVIVVNKPSGMIVHPGAGNENNTLVNAVLFHVKDLSGINGVKRPGIVHRIDKDTSGLLMIAKNDDAHNFLAQQLKDKTVTRKYIALVHGNVQVENGTIDAPIGRDENERVRMAVTAKNSKNAITHFKVLERFETMTLIECVLETGRTHQIRAHMKYINHPLVGDGVYGPRKVVVANGQLLHAKTLGFIHPTTREYVEFDSELPEFFESYLKELRK